MPQTRHRATPDRLDQACRATMGACHPEHRAARAAVGRAGRLLMPAASGCACADAQRDTPTAQDPVLDAHTRRAMGRWHPHTAASARALRTYAIGQPDPGALEGEPGGVGALSPPTVGRYGTPAGLVEALREHGITPSYSFDDDDDLIDLLTTLGRQRDAREEATGESGVKPQPVLGVNQAILYFDDADGAVQSLWGRPWYAMMPDIAAAGIGTIRHLGEGNELTFLSLFGDAASIPGPPELYDRLVADDFAMFRRFTELVCGAAVLGLRLVPALFMREAALPDNLAAPQDGPPAPMQDPGWKPSYVKVIPRPSYAGWEYMYWEPAVVPGWDHDDGKRDFEQYGLDVWWHPDDPAGYHAGCARRKALGLAAFSLAVGRYFKVLDQALREIGLPLHEVVPTVEISNEPDSDWLPEDGTTAPGNAFEDSATAFGALVAAIAGPFRHAAGPDGPKVRVGELLSFHRVATCDEDVADCLSFERHFQWQKLWLQRVLSGGVVSQHERWMRNLDYAEGGSIDLSGALWYDACAELDFFWPVITTYDGASAAPYRYWDGPDAGAPATAGELVQQVGLHWYHAQEELWAPGCDPFPEGYFGPIDAPDYVPTFLLSDAIHQFRTAVVYGTQGDGFDLKLSVSETGFPAVSFDWRRGQPLSSVDGIDCPRKDLDSSELLQAGMLVRRMVQLRALGVSPVGWHAYLASTKDADKPETWSYFSGMGLRRDLFSDLDDNTVERDGYRRAAWYALRRFAWIVSQSAEISTLVNGSDGTAFCLPSSRKLPDPASWHEPTGPRTWNGVLIAWLDQAVGAPSRNFYVRADDLRRAPLVPEIAAPGIPSDDENGWPAGESVDWTWEGWDAHAVRRGLIDGQTWWRLHLLRTSVEVPSPLGLVWRNIDALRPLEVVAEDDLNADWSPT